MKKLFWLKVLFFTVMISVFMLFNIIADVWGFIFIGFVLGFLFDWFLKKKGYLIEKSDISINWTWVCLAIFVIMNFLPANDISIFIMEWIQYLFLVGFFFWPEIAYLKSGKNFES